MKIKIHAFLLIMALIFSVAVLAAQTSECDVVLLKNGNIIKGKIIELIPDKSIKIEITGGSIFIYSMSEIEKITKESIPSTSSAADISHDNNNTIPGSSFSIYAGTAITLGNFAEEGGTTWPAWINDILNSPPMQNPGFPRSGCARAGFTAGVQFTTSGTIGWIIDATYAQNNVSHNPSWRNPSPQPSGTTIDIETDKWTSMIVLTGIKIGTTNPSSTNFFFAPLIGVIYSRSPKITATISNVETVETIELESASSSAAAFGANVEFTFWRHATFGIRYVYTEPHYNISYTLTDGVSSPSGTISHKQSTSLILAYIGFSF